MPTTKPTWLTYREPLSDRQLAALKARAAFTGPATGDLRQGVRDASEWLAARLADFPPQSQGQRVELRKVLREYALREIHWDQSKYEDGIATVLDDVLRILDNEPDAMCVWIATAEAKGIH